jgi:serine/threonine-protein kinase
VKHSLKPGTAVTSNVRLVRPLCEGGMGALWVADHHTLDTEVAVKFLHDRYADHGEADVRFEAEAKAAAKIKSPHVVQIFDYGRMKGGTAYIVMEKLDGESLAQRLQRTGWLSFDQCVEVVRQVCKALKKADELSIVHRDIKPANIFLCFSDDGIFAKLVDFGVARDRSSREGRRLTNPGNMVGSVEYMCRDQVISASEPTLQTDLWGLAAVAYEMVTGDVPFTGETYANTCMAIAAATPVPPSTLRKGVPDTLDAWFARAFERDPSKRFESPGKFAAAFRAALFAERHDVDDELSGDTPRPGLLRHPPTLGGLGPAHVGVREEEDASSSSADEDSSDESAAPLPGLVVPLKRRSRWIAALALLALISLSLFLSWNAQPNATQEPDSTVAPAEVQAEVPADEPQEQAEPSATPTPDTAVPTPSFAAPSTRPRAPPERVEPDPRTPPENAVNDQPQPTYSRPDHGF